MLGGPLIHEEGLKLYEEVLKAVMLHLPFSPFRAAVYRMLHSETKTILDAGCGFGGVAVAQSRFLRRVTPSTKSLLRTIAKMAVMHPIAIKERIAP